MRFAIYTRTLDRSSTVIVACYSTAFVPSLPSPFPNAGIHIHNRWTTRSFLLRFFEHVERFPNSYDVAV